MGQKGKQSRFTLCDLESGAYFRTGREGESSSNIAIINGMNITVN